MHDLQHTLIYLALLSVWVGWCLGAIDWRKLWPRLADGAWAPLVLLTLMIAGVWSWISPGACTCLGITIPSLWWHLLATALLVGLGLVCGWLQILAGWHPTEVELHPAAVHGQGHEDHGHAGDGQEAAASHGH